MIAWWIEQTPDNFNRINVNKLANGRQLQSRDKMENNRYMQYITKCASVQQATGSFHGSLPSLFDWRNWTQVANDGVKPMNGVNVPGGAEKA